MLSIQHNSRAQTCMELSCAWMCCTVRSSPRVVCIIEYDLHHVPSELKLCFCFLLKINNIQDFYVCSAVGFAHIRAVNFDRNYLIFRPGSVRAAEH